MRNQGACVNFDFAKARQLEGFDQPKLVAFHIDGIATLEVVVHLEVQTSILTWNFVGDKGATTQCFVASIDDFGRVCSRVGVISDLLS